MNENQASLCPVCNEKGVLFHKSTFPGKDNTIYQLFQCGECRTVFTCPRPTLDALTKAYDAYYWSETDIDKKKKGLKRLVAGFNSWRLKQVIRPLVKVLPPRATVLEVGCGAGQLSRILLEHDFQVEVTEYSHQMLSLVTETLGVKGYPGDLTEIELNKRYDAIIFNNVLEHVLSPADNLRRAVSILNPGGFVFIEVPNIDSWQFAVFRQHWYPLDIPIHLTHFGPATLDSLAGQAGVTLYKRSFFSMRSSMAGIVVSLFPSFDPRNIRHKSSSWILFVYLGMQVAALPLALIESLSGKGGIMRSIYRSYQ
ncbi:MAG: class I SAM-dependent methyltransferase [Thermodesulfobacteriota bacterium]